jgi:hypothetical protein
MPYPPNVTVVWSNESLDESLVLRRSYNDSGLARVANPPNWTKSPICHILRLYSGVVRDHFYTVVGGIG